MTVETSEQKPLPGSAAPAVQNIVQQSANAQSDSAKKRMRKGTRSCLECRSRKIRCIFPQGSSECNACKAHGRRCMEQTYGYAKEAGLDKRVGLKERVRELEALVNKLVSQKQQGGGSPGEDGGDSRRESLGMLSPPDSHDADSPRAPSIGRQAQELVNELYEDMDDLDSSLEKAPVMSLFDNPILQHEKDSTVGPGQQTTLAFRTRSKPLNRIRQAKASRVCEEIRNLLPSKHDIDLIFAAHPHSWPIWRKNFPESNFMPDATPQDIIYPLLHSTDSIKLLKATIYLALLLQQLPPGSIQGELELSKRYTPLHLSRRYYEIANEYLLSDDGIACSIDGVEACNIMCKLCINDGRPRKAYIISQRAISYARLLGYNRPSSWKTPNNPQIGDRRKIAWLHLWLGERYMSLILGLPNSIHDNLPVDISQFADDLPLPLLSSEKRGVGTFMLKMGAITGKIIERNQSLDPAIAAGLESTMKIDAELHAMSCQMPDSWWDLSYAEDRSTVANLPPMEMFDMATAQLWFHECRLNLHMPFMLNRQKNAAGKNFSPNQYAYNRTTALKCSRGIIRCHAFLRSRVDLAGILCQVVDFQVFTAALLLLLDLMVRPNEEECKAAVDGAPVTSSPWDNEEVRCDFQLLMLACENLRSLAENSEPRNSIAGQGLKVLNSLGRILYGCADPDDANVNRVIIPYFGAITIHPRRTNLNAPPNREQVEAIKRKVESEYNVTIGACPNCESIPDPNQAPQSPPQDSNASLSRTSTESASQSATPSIPFDFNNTLPFSFASPPQGGNFFDPNAITFNSFTIPSLNPNAPQGAAAAAHPGAAPGGFYRPPQSTVSPPQSDGSSSFAPFSNTLTNTPSNSSYEFNSPPETAATAGTGGTSSGYGSPPSGALYAQQQQQQGLNAVGGGNGAGGDIEMAGAWDEGVWQSLLTQDPSLDLNADWEWLGGAASL